MNDEQHESDHLKIMLATAEEFAAQLRIGVEALHRPFTSCEVANAANLIGARGHFVADLAPARDRAEQWAMPEMPAGDFANAEFVDPKKARAFVSAWDKLLSDVESEVVAFREFVGA